MDGICKIDDCERKVHSRGLCSHHYFKFKWDGTLDKQANSVNPNHHRLTDIDEEAKTAVCSVCGPVGIRLRKNRGHVCKNLQHKYDVGGRYKPYSITVGETQALLERQNGCCAICKDTLVLEGSGRNSRIDHDHTTSTVRGFLCIRCNSGLGMFRDNPVFLGNAIKYLEKPET